VASNAVPLAPFPGQGRIKVMSAENVVNFGEYRAARDAAKRRTIAPTPYVLWYPGVGYLHVIPSVSPIAPARVAAAGHE